MLMPLPTCRMLVCVLLPLRQRGMSAMHHAAALGDLPALRLLLERTDAKELLERRDRVRVVVVVVLLLLLL